ncbi:hypothetical protein RJ639_019638 [Escallonia herrerae]|uniref:Uncharacterized protein n=1 Tax=Escallonia herrerae TaxID=1293975 RepID=A0AA88VAW0_9ASTE|nr:hypothetical protein RJ639_019638 [Escallonia herrerae]
MSIVRKRLFTAVDQRDHATILPLMRLYPPLGLEEEGLQAYIGYLKKVVSMRSRLEFDQLVELMEQSYSSSSVGNQGRGTEEEGPRRGGGVGPYKVFTEQGAKLYKDSAQDILVTNYSFWHPPSLAYSPVIRASKKIPPFDYLGHNQTVITAMTFPDARHKQSHNNNRVFKSLPKGMSKSPCFLQPEEVELAKETLIPEVDFAVDSQLQNSNCV